MGKSFKNAHPSQGGGQLTQEPPDEELAKRAKAGESAAFSELSERYAPTLKSRANRYAGVVGQDIEDFFHEGLLALFRAVKGFDELSVYRFKTYAVTCINNSMASAIKKHMKNQNAELPLQEDEGQEPLQPEDFVLEREGSAQLLLQIHSLLSDFERRVLSLYLRGNSYLEIACALATTTKAADNALQRVRRKLRPEL
jgi:RNA polymerase sporulation-specific sigma factor